MPLTATLADVLDSAIAAARSDFGSLQQLDRASGDLRLVAQRGFEPWWVEFWNTVSKGQGACGAALERFEPVVVADVDTDPIFVGTPSHAIQQRAGVRAVFSLPIRGGAGGVIGMISTHFRVPYRPAAAVLRSIEPLCRRAAELIEPAASRPLILLVDDDGDLRAVYRGLLEGRGCEVAEAADGRAALHYLTSEARLPALILGDCVMPEMSGPELAAAVKFSARLAHIPVVLMTGDPTRARGETVLVKPVGAAALGRFFDAVLERLRAATVAAAAEEVPCGHCGGWTPLRPYAGTHGALTFCRSCGAPVPLSR